MKNFTILSLKHSCLILMWCLFSGISFGQIYVDASAGGANDGSDWGNAYLSLQDALDDACMNAPVEIWIAAGSYYPDEGSNVTNDDRNATFQLCNGVAIYGGFDGTETMLSERDWETNVTILSGDINQSMNLTGNSYTVVTGSGTDSTAVLDGFTITGGNADVNSFLPNPNFRGGAIFSNEGSFSLKNAILENNSAGWGGAMYLLNSANLTIENAAILGNQASFSGGGMYNNNSSPTVTNSTYSGNTATAGSGMFNDNSSPTVTNSTFSGNFSAERGGGMYNLGNSSPTVTNSTFSGNTANEGGGMYNVSSSSPTITNCTFSGNTANNNGGGMYNVSSSSPTVANCIIWNNSADGNTSSTSASVFNIGSNPEFSYSLIANSGGSGSWDSDIGIDDGNNIDADPLFVEDVDLDSVPTTSGNLQLLSCSPAINGGNPDTTGLNLPATDLAGNPRIVNDTIDMGAYEQGGVPCGLECPEGSVVYVREGGTGIQDGSSWANATASVQDALEMACGCFNIQQIWVAAGVYYPDEGLLVNNDDREATFQLCNGVTIYGGFPNTGNPDMMDRDWTTHETILSGDINQNGDLDDNSYSVVTGSGTDSTAVIDGFTITMGNADGIFPNNLGGGMYNSAGSPTVTNCIFSENTALDGGAMYNLLNSPTVTNCSFSGNSASNGGGMYNNDSSPTVTNCIFSENTALDGGGMYNLSNFPTVTNCNFFRRRTALHPAPERAPAPA